MAVPLRSAARDRSHGPQPDGLLGLQRRAGNAVVARLLSVSRQAEPTPAAPADRIEEKLAKADPIAGVNSDYHGAFRILNGAPMYDILATLDQLQVRGRYAELAGNIAEARGVNMPRLRVAFAAVDVKGTTAAITFDDTHGANLGTLPADQQHDIATYLGVKFKSDAPPAPPPAPTQVVVGNVVIDIPPESVPIPKLADASVLLSAANGANFGGDPAIRTFAEQLAQVYADRAAEGEVAKRYAAEKAAAEQQATKVAVTGETAKARRDRAKAAVDAVTAPTREDVAAELRTTKLAWLERDFPTSLVAARPRFGAKGLFTAFATGWMVARREQVDFDTLMSMLRTADGKPIAELKNFDPAPDDTALEPIVKPGSGTPVAPVTNRFITELAGHHSAFSASNRPNHGGGTFLNRGLSLDLNIVGKESKVDDRGFWERRVAVPFMIEVARAAAAVGCDWRALYDDYAVAAAVNKALGARHLVFTANVDKGGSLNWHGPLVLHFHLDLVPQRQ